MRSRITTPPGVNLARAAPDPYFPTTLATAHISFYLAWAHRGPPAGSSKPPRASRSSCRRKEASPGKATGPLGHRSQARGWCCSAAPRGDACSRGLKPERRLQGGWCASWACAAAAFFVAASIGGVGACCCARIKVAVLGFFLRQDEELPDVRPS